MLLGFVALVRRRLLSILLLLLLPLSTLPAAILRLSASFEHWPSVYDDRIVVTFVGAVAVTAVTYPGGEVFALGSLARPSSLSCFSRSFLYADWRY
jgi:hypothetical protein